MATLPSSLDAERALVSCMCHRPDLIPAVRSKLNSDFFFHDTVRDIFSAVIAVVDNGNPPELIPIVEEMKRQKTATHSVMADVSDIISFMPSGGMIDYYAELVMEKHIVRLLARASLEFVGQNLESVDADQSIQRFEKTAKECRDIQSGFLEDGSEAKTVVDEYFRSVEEAAKRGSPPYRETRWKTFNQQGSGLYEQELTIISGFPSDGKTAWTLNIANDFLRDNLSVAIFSLDMRRKPVMHRMMADLTGIPIDTLYSGKMNQHQLPVFTREIASLSKRKLYLNDDAEIGADEILGHCHALKRKWGTLDLVIVDFIQLVAPRPGISNTTEALTHTATTLKKCSTVIGARTMLISQLNDDEKLKGARAIGEAADDYYKIRKPKTEDKRTFDCMKRRNHGRGWSFTLDFAGNLCRFSDPAQDF